MKDFILELEYELLIVGGILLATIIIPFNPLNRLGNFINNALYRVRLSSPFPQIINGTISLTLLIGLLGLFVCTYLFMNYYRRYLKAFDQRKLVPDRENVTRFREERNLYIWASSCITYLSLHTFARLNQQKEEGSRIRTETQAQNAVNAMEARASAATTAGTTAASTTASARPTTQDVKKME